jgi:transcriptional regulator with XRE-family HTH domain
MDDVLRIIGTIEQLCSYGRRCGAADAVEIADYIEILISMLERKFDGILAVLTLSRVWGHVSIQTVIEESFKVPNRLGKTIRILREAKGLTLAELVRKAKISKPFLSLIENGHRDPSLGVIHRIARGLDIPVEALVLMGMNSPRSLESSDLATKEIMKSVDRMMTMEGQLRRLLGNQEDDSIQDDYS